MRSRVTSTRPPAIASVVGAAIAATVTIAALHAPAVNAQPASLETSSLPAARDLPRAPAFRAKQLMELPRAGWNTNGGTLYNQRYSPLTQINRDNVANLRAEWRASLGGSGMGPRSANQAQPLVYDGVIYVITGDNDAFAIDVDSGQVLWKYAANVDANVARPCCGWAARGLGLRRQNLRRAARCEDRRARPAHRQGCEVVSIVAIEAATGKYRWHLQQVHHDMRTVRWRRITRSWRT